MGWGGDLRSMIEPGVVLYGMGGGKAVQGGTGTCHGRGGAPTAHFLGLNSHGVVIMISFFSLSSIIHVSFGK